MKILTILISTCVLFASSAFGQGFTSGSDGTDGALDVAADQGELVFDPGGWGVDADGDHIFHFTTITIGANTTLRLTADHLGRAPIFLATGDVSISGTLDLRGQTGKGVAEIRNNADVIPATPGAGGYAGGLGQANGEGSAFATIGGGPGGGALGTSWGGLGGNSDYMNRYLVPLLGGSGGGGGQTSGANTQSGGCGGAGGGAILIASSTQISVSGTVDCSGGNGGLGYLGGGGGGSGGAIRLAAPVVEVSGSLIAPGGGKGGSQWTPAYGGVGGTPGKIRIESFTRTIAGTLNPPAVYGAPYETFLPTRPPSRIAVTSVGGVAITNPTASFETPDAVVNSSNSVDVVIETQNIPLAATITLYVLPMDGDQQEIDVTGLAGSEASASVTQSVTLPPGFSRGFVKANWGP